MSWRVKVTGSGVVAAEGEKNQDVQIPHGEYEMSKRSDGRYELRGNARSFLIVAPEDIGAEVYLAQKVADRTLQVIGGDKWP